jgi:hypothetical protein
MKTELEKQVDEAAVLSITANSIESRQLARRKRKEAREAIDIAMMHLGKLISILNQFPKD